ncbi:sodium/calcium exchanger regulatory protein 1-like [Mercenaria mercenaria]|uniref:sodium/calcium exchanger regulatory protein 1-like n=1 Tax=Mercenaria mercenaria TaxID=6596 RepID=UPI001E1DE29A|nr:sodium/calcium exchanger regulatory protein 1-like [Mercenaria mercenaria]
MKELVGKWKLHHDKNDNFEEYLKAVGINFAFRKMGKAVVPVEEFKQEDDENWSLCVAVSIAHSTLKFKFGEEFHETTMDGRKCKTTFSISEDGHLIQYQKSVHPNIPDTKITRKKEDDETFIQIYEAIGTNVKSVRRFIRQQA